MLLAKDCAHLTSADWAGIASKIIKPEEGEAFLLAISDAHAGGVTSCMPEVQQVVDGFARQANILLLNGDDFEFESPAAFMTAFEELRKRGAKMKTAEYRRALLAEAEAVLHQKVAEDIATLSAIIRENPERKIVKIIGNHENFDTFRDALSKLEAQYPNFQWMPELAVIPMPGGKKGERDRLLAAHGDLQMDDLWFVEEGGTDRERKCYTHREMAEKVVSIATNYWAPSAQKQEKGQGLVNWWRKPNATAKTLYAELLFRAHEGDFHHDGEKTKLNMDILDFTERKLKKRKKKFESFQEELAQRPDITAEHRQAEALVYSRAIEKMEQQITELEERRIVLEKKSDAFFPTTFKSPTTILHYKKLGEHDSRLFTSKALERVTHINYGHTHVSAEGVEINGLGDAKITVSNNASVTGAIMQKTLDEEGKPRIAAKGEAAATDVGNLSALLYRVKDGKITGITTVGRLITENIHLVKQLIRDVPKPQKTLEDAPAVPPFRVIASNPSAIASKRADGHQNNGHSAS